MTSTAKQEKASKKYYDSNAKYRRKKIEDILKDQKRNPTKYAKKSRDYYNSNEEYREYKKKYAKKYRKENPVKSKARKDRKAYK